MINTNYPEEILINEIGSSRSIRRNNPLIRLTRMKETLRTKKKSSVFRNYKKEMTLLPPHLSLSTSLQDEKFTRTDNRFNRLNTTMTALSVGTPSFRGKQLPKLRAKSLVNDIKFRTDGFNLQKKLKKLEKTDPGDKIILNVQNFMKKLESKEKPKKKKKNESEEYKDMFIIETVKFDKEVPKSISFLKRMMVIVSIDCKNKNFPCFVRVDKKNSIFEFYVTFDGRTPSHESCDYRHYGDSFIIEENSYNVGCEKLLVLIKRTEKIRVMLSISFTSKKKNFNEF